MSPAYLRIEEPRPRGAPPSGGFALWQLGFRPFYLLAGGFAALSVPLWALQFAGWLPRPYLHGPLWHAHEMLFGFVLAVIVGFLFTAGRNWSGQPTPTGAALAALALLWLAARVLVLTPWGWAAAAANVAFPLAAALGLARPLHAAGNRRNYFFVGLLALLGVAALALHLGALGLLPNLLRGMAWRTDRLAKAFDDGMYATDKAVELAVAGMPFREAYRLAAVEPLPRAGADAQASLDARVSPGGAGVLGLETIRQRLAGLARPA